MCQHVPGLVREGALGEVRLVSGHYLQDWLLLEEDWHWRGDPAQGGALRAVADIGSHWLDLTAFLTGQPVSEVMADLATFIKRRGDREVTTEDAATIMVRYARGARAAMTVSQVSPGRKNSLAFEIDGSKSPVAWNSGRPDPLGTRHPRSPPQVLLRAPA